MMTNRSIQYNDNHVRGFVFFPECANIYANVLGIFQKNILILFMYFCIPFSVCIYIGTNIPIFANYPMLFKYCHFHSPL